MKNYGYMASLRPFSKCHSLKIAKSQNRRFRNTTSICHRFIMFTSKYVGFFYMGNLNNLVTNITELQNYFETTGTYINTQNTRFLILI